MARRVVLLRYHLLIAVFCLLFSPLSAFAQQADIQRADELMKTGNSAAAFALLDPLEDKMAGNAEFDYLLGIAALDSGKSDRATIAFERVLAVNPNFAGARLDMARAYFQLGDLQRAKTEFETVLSQNPPEGARQVVIKYLDTIKSVEAAKRRQLKSYAEFTLGRDTNVNASGSQSQVGIPALNNVLFTLNPLNVKRPDSYKAAAAGVDYLEQVTPQLGLFAGADFRDRVNFTQDRFDNDSIDGRVGVAVGEATNQLRVSMSGGRYGLDNALSRKTQGFAGEWKLQINPANQFNAFTQLMRLRFTDLATQVNSFDQSTSGVGWLRVLADGKAVAFGNYIFGTEHDTDGRADGAKSFDGGRLGGQLMLRSDLDLFAVGSVQTGRYDRENAAFSNAAQGISTKRHDFQTDYSIGLTWRFAKGWSLRPVFLQSRNNSNIPINAYQRTDYSFTVRRDFN